MFQNKKQLKIILDTLTLVIGLGIVTNILSNVIEEELRMKVPHTYSYILLFCLILLVCIRLYFEKIFDKDRLPLKNNSQEDRLNLIESLQKRYQARLSKKMDTELGLSIQLKLKYTKEGTSEEFISTYFMDRYSEKPVADFDQLFSDFTTKLKRLLIIGDPGAGKTVLLLHFARRLLEIAKQEDTYPIPIILNLSSYREEGQSFEHWLEQNLVYSAGQYGTSKEHAKELAISDNLLLLLDGLDEIPEGHRNACLKRLFVYLKKINRQRSTLYPEVIVCCRREEYKQMQADAPVQAAINIEPLNMTVVRRELTELKKQMGIKGNAAGKLLTNLSKYPHLPPLLTTAFYLHLALKLSDEDYDFTKVESEKGLVKTYIDQQLDILTPQYNPDRSKQILSWLAHKLFTTRKGIIFELEDMQPDWARKKWLYKMISTLMPAILIGMVYSIIIEVYFELGFYPNLLFTLFYSLTFGIIPAFIYNLKSRHIEIKELRFFNLKAFNGRGFLQKLFSWLLFGIAFSAFLQILHLLIFGIRSGYEIIQQGTEARVMMLTSMIEWSMFGLTAGLAIGLVTGFLEGAFASKRNSILYTPYQRLYNSLIFDFFQWCLAIIVVIAFIKLTYKIKIESVDFYPIEYGIGMGACIAIIVNPLFKHIILRLILSLEGVIPLRFVTFLNLVAEKTGLLEKDGGQWRFRHQLIQDMLRKEGSL